MRGGCCLSDCSSGGPDKLLAEENTRKAFSACVSYGLEFCFYKMVSIGGKVYKTWSQARGVTRLCHFDVASSVCKLKSVLSFLSVFF